ncbi:hypothetical protein LX36DRAFT_725370 [Colletotrichum falcatum]|nr:hypothetical protein LX36DRAFT_725370 [Colletotrichum falcatum]
MPCHAMPCVVSAGVSEALQLAAPPPPTPSLPHHAHLPQPTTRVLSTYGINPDQSHPCWGVPTAQPNGPGPASQHRKQDRGQYCQRLLALGLPLRRHGFSLVPMTNAGPGRAHWATWESEPWLKGADGYPQPTQ